MRALFDFVSQRMVNEAGKEKVEALKPQQLVLRTAIADDQKHLENINRLKELRRKAPALFTGIGKKKQELSALKKEIADRASASQMSGSNFRDNQHFKEA